ncbi:MAG: hypothetical protein ACRDOT_08675 [Aeromicrobium sp.]
MTLGLSIALTVVPLIVFLTGGALTRQVVLGVAALLVAAYAATVHPLSVFVALAAVLGFVPYLDLPGANIPVLLVLAVGVWVALAFLPGADLRPGGPELWVLALAGVALLSVATDLSADSLTELAAWLVATAVIVPIRFLPQVARTLVIRTFVISAAAAAAVGSALVRLDPDGSLLSNLTFAGYSSERVRAQFVPGTEAIATRLTGTFVEPNIAGLVLAAAVMLAVAYFSGPVRIALVVLIGGGLLLTLSRTALATVVVAGAVLVLRAGGRRSLALIASGVVAGLGALTIPNVRGRLLDSFGASDTGTIARSRALEAFPEAMEGHWIWGLGWAREEFRNASLSSTVNYVANGPLMTIYRGGMVLGILTMLLLVVLVVRSWIVAKRSFEDAVVCSAVIGFVLVALQLDFPIVLQTPATVVFSFVVGLSLVPHPPPRSIDA